MTPIQRAVSANHPSTWSENLAHLVVDEHEADDRAVAEHDAANEHVPVPDDVCPLCGGVMVTWITGARWCSGCGQGAR